MNKSDLIEALAVKENLTDKQATDTINLIFAGFTDALKIREFLCEGIQGLCGKEPQDRRGCRCWTEEAAIL
jgi:hypothetical protein